MWYLPYLFYNYCVVTNIFFVKYTQSYLSLSHLGLKIYGVDKSHADAAAEHTKRRRFVTKEKSFKDEELAETVDLMMSEGDRNGDGYIDYEEFVQAQNW